jgi:hypothetical protein
MIHSLDWPTLQERKARLHIFYKIINNKIAVPYDNILIHSQSRTRSTHSNTIRQIQCNKDSFKFSFFCRTIKDWNKLLEHITNSTSTEIFRDRNKLKKKCLARHAPESNLHQVEDFPK